MGNEGTHCICTGAAHGCCFGGTISVSRAASGSFVGGGDGNGSEIRETPMTNVCCLFVMFE